MQAQITDEQLRNREAKGTNIYGTSVCALKLVVVVVIIVVVELL